ncbi:MAG: acyltransferase [Burkholderiales bacterium]|nr:acyltransferase [Burkholderiales bacterium]
MYSLLQRLRRPTASTTYVPQIDGLRFLALVPVLVWHAGLRGERFHAAHSGAALAVDERISYWLPHGHLGVFIFFFISGYIIAYPFLAGRAPSLSSFYKRRLYRLEPPYILAMCLSFLALYVVGYKPEQAPSFREQEGSLVGSLAASLLYLHGLVFNAPPRLNPPAWSLEIEIQFYLLAPFLITFLAARKSLLVTCGAVVGSIVLSAMLDQWFGIHGLQNRTILGHAYGFILGVAVCRYAAEKDPFMMPPARRFDLLGWGCVVLLLASGVLEHKGLTPFEEAIRNAARAALMVGVYFGVARGICMRRLFSNPLVTVAGGMCYSVYLVHVPLMQATAGLLFKHYIPGSAAEAVLIAWLVLIPVSLCGGLLFYVIVERPCMAHDWPQRLARRVRALARASFTAETAGTTQR